MLAFRPPLFDTPSKVRVVAKREVPVMQQSPTTPPNGSSEKVLPLRQEGKTQRKLSEEKKPNTQKPQVTPPPEPEPEQPSPAEGSQQTPTQPSAPDSTVIDLPLNIGQPPLPGQTATAPPAPSDLPQFALAGVERPGGSILVLGIKVNDQGQVVDAVIVVPSYAPLTDIGLLMAYKQQTFTELKPPLLPGEHRWLEVRLDLEDLFETKRGVLP